MRVLIKSLGITLSRRNRMVKTDVANGHHGGAPCTIAYLSLALIPQTRCSLNPQGEILALSITLGISITHHCFMSTMIRRRRP
jgi:hypothetical protein